MMKELNLIYFAAQELPPEERPAYLTQACAGDHELRTRVEQMLAIAGQADAFFTKAMSEVPSEDQESDRGPGRTLKVSPDDASGEIVGQKIGRYKILERVGEGGCGVVYVAEQTEPVRRRVALKVIRLGMDTKAVVARFEAERQALAMMDHPNIAKVLDAGATESGRPYFIMELVRGIKITEYCDTANLSTRDRLDLFIKVCEAIQHAHQKGIIHRDIKPSNILVTVNDGAPVPKVIDFGIAKATEGRLTEATVYTQLHQFIGTPAYMSPEQAEMSSLDIDTRSDIYSLGVLLYELLTGKTPFDEITLMSKGLDAMRRTIREVEPARPSTRLATFSGDDLTTVARRRSIPANQLQNQLRGDLDWIAMKALEKDRTRRYDTANGLATDIRRHLNTEPVVARPSSLGYRLEKTVRRNKLAFAAGAAIAASLVVGIAVSVSQAVRARAEATRAMAAEKKTAETLAQVAAERDAKDLARQDAEAISRLLVNVFQSPDPSRDGRTITVAETLDRAVMNLGRTLANQPDRRAQLQAVLGATYSHLGLSQQAVPLKEAVYAYTLKKLGPENTNTLTSMLSLAVTYFDVGRRDEALKLREEGVALRRKVLGPEHPDTLSVENDLAISCHEAGRRDQAMKLMEEVRALRLKVNGPEHPDTLRAIGNLGLLYSDAGRKDEALQVREQMLALSRKVNGAEHPDTLRAMGNLALSYSDVGRKDEARTLQEQVLALSRKVLGPEHPSTFDAMNNLAFSYVSAGRLEEALKLREEVLALRRKVLGPEHPATIKAMNNLAKFYADTGRQNEAIQLNEEVRALRRKVRGPEDRETPGAMTNLAISYGQTGRLEAAALRKERSVAQSSPLPPVVATLVPPDSEWKWLHPTDGVDPAGSHPNFHTVFFTPGYDDSAWKSGKDSADPNGGFGYGRNFSGVDIGLPSDENHRHSAYFRHRFTTDKPHTHLELRCQRDDAMIVYLDGAEVLRDNLPAGPEAYLISATIPQGSDNDGVIYRFPIRGTLASGQHLLAISVHNTELPSSDLRIGGITLVEIAEEPKTSSNHGEQTPRSATNHQP